MVVSRCMDRKSDVLVHGYAYVHVVNEAEMKIFSNCMYPPLWMDMCDVVCNLYNIAPINIEVNHRRHH